MLLLALYSLLRAVQIDSRLENTSLRQQNCSYSQRDLVLMGMLMDIHGQLGSAEEMVTKAAAGQAAD